MEIAHGKKEDSDIVFLPIMVDKDGRQIMRIDAEPVYASIIDTTSSAEFTYMCEAAPGTLHTAAGWRICRVEKATGITTWADGDANFDNVAENRTALAYS